MTTQLFTTVEVQLTEDCRRKFYVLDDGTALMFCNVLTNGGAPVATENPLPVEDGGRTMTYAAPETAAVGTGSAILIPAGAFANRVTIATLPGSTTNVWLRPDGSPAVASTGICVKAGGNSVTFGVEALPLPTANITAITDAGAPQTVTIVGG